MKGNRFVDSSQKRIKNEQLFEYDREAIIKKVADTNKKIFIKKKVNYNLDYLDKDNSRNSHFPKSDKNNNSVKRNQLMNTKEVRENSSDAEHMKE